MEKERDFAIDVVKFIAVLLIINSHADIMYPHLSILATGGAIGDCIFLFCSGFTLWMGGGKTFESYYKRRVNRIYPSVFVSIAFIHIIKRNSCIRAIEFAGGEFIIAIMFYYVLLYVIRQYAINYVKWIIILVALISLLIYVFWFPYKYETSSKGIYGITTYYRWIPYFVAMLLGAYLGRIRLALRYDTVSDSIKLFICLFLFYSIQFVAKIYRPVAPLQIVTIIPLMGVVVYFYKWCNNNIIRKMYSNRHWNFLILTVSGLCLESYLINGYLLTDKLNAIWPLNLIIIISFILMCAYFVRCVARIFSQTFSTEDYEWRKIIAMK